MQNRPDIVVVMYSDPRSLIQDDYFSADSPESKTIAPGDPATAPKVTSKRRRQLTIAWDWIKEKTNSFWNLLRHYAVWIGFLNTVAAWMIQKIPPLILRATEFILPIARLVTGLRLLNRTLHLNGKWTRVVFLLGGLCAISLGIAAIAFPLLGPALATANIVYNALLGLWLLGVALKNKYWGSWKNESDLMKQEQEEFYQLLAKGSNFANYKRYKQKDPAALQDITNFRLSELEQSIVARKNLNNKLNADLAVKAYNLAIIGIALVGIVMTFYPPTLALGAGILLAVSFHGLLLGYDIGGQWPQKVQNFFFGPSQASSDEELELQVALRQSKGLSTTAVTQVALQAEEKESPSPRPPKSGKTVDSVRMAPPPPARNGNCCFRFWNNWFNRPSREERHMPAANDLDVMPMHDMGPMH